MRISWTKPAENDLDNIFDFIAGDNPVAATDVILEIIDTAEILIVEHTPIGKAGRIHETREFVVPDYPAYIILYRVEAGTLEILRVLHAARQWPEGL